MAPHQDIDTPSLKFVFALEFNVAKPVIMPKGPRGTRILIPIKGGTFRGGEGHEDFHGDIVGPSSDWATVLRSGERPCLHLDVRIIFKTHDGDVIVGQVEGRSDRDPKNAGNAKVHTTLSLEAGEEKYKWMNTKILVGKRQKDGAHIKINYYEIV
eukprot:CAMPEP_0194131782 /NCGR_PEP_ID=MMETSP0152-20130528/2461_1 /TAXON_ID=1049557 /ORGANISM="Thalassiothrix antarctica, Strain L6-D1" /LENGTH=154 /DNA_ID=CAMNT_0038826659 /DNA_START=101 /DNA_END=565 /DNA_ORIENTATION=+